jgi:hypothetical protein
LSYPFGFGFSWGEEKGWYMVDTISKDKMQFERISELLLQSDYNNVRNRINELIEFINQRKNLYDYIISYDSYNIKKEIDNVIMNYGTTPINLGIAPKEKASNTYKLLNYILLQNIPIDYLKISYSNSLDHNKRTSQFIKTIIMPLMDYIGTYYAEKSQNTANKSQSGIKKIVMIHGHDSGLKHELTDYLKNDMLLPEPVVLSLSSRGQTVMEKFELEVNEADLIFVLTAPEDFNCKLASLPKRNILLELGYLIGKLGKKSEKLVILLKNKDNVNLPTDIYGLEYIEIKAQIVTAGDALKNKINPLLNNKM